MLTRGQLGMVMSSSPSSMTVANITAYLSWSMWLLRESHGLNPFHSHSILFELGGQDGSAMPLTHWVRTRYRVESEISLGAQSPEAKPGQA